MHIVRSLNLGPDTLVLSCLGKSIIENELSHDLAIFSNHLGFDINITSIDLDHYIPNDHLLTLNPSRPTTKPSAVHGSWWGSIKTELLMQHGSSGNFTVESDSLLM